MMKQSPRRKAIVRTLIAACVIALLYTPVRVFVLIYNGRKIAEVSQKFKRDYFVGNTADKPFTYVAMGDSTAAGWGAGVVELTYPHQIAEAVVRRGYYVHVVNNAVGGAKLNDVCVKQLPQLGKSAPDLITITAGANDATNSTPHSEYSRDLQILFTALQKSGAKRILIANAPDMYQIPALTESLASSTNERAVQLNTLFNKALQTANIKEPKLVKVDLYNQGKLIYRDDKSLYAADHFHPSANGYAVWAKVFLKNLDNL